ncbi:MAG: EamA family transporter RarD [Spartobacteria bacterium]
MSILRNDSAKSQQTSALIAGIAAFSTWGLIPVYWKLLRNISAPEIVSHRIVWTSLFLIGLLTWQRRWPEVKSALTSRRTALYCLSSGLAVASNWMFFIWAVNINRVIETSLGYFMTPLVNVLLGAVFLHERLTKLQLASVLLATSGVLYLTFGYGRFPWIAVTLSMTFGLYGLLRKKSGTAAIPGLFLETVLLVPLAFAYLAFLKFNGALLFDQRGWSMSILLISTGVVTAIPLAWFGYATRYLRLTTVGFLQYLAPSGSLFLGIFLYHEPFTRGHFVTFGLIWIALAIFTYEAVTRWRSGRVRDAMESAVCETPA